MLKKLLFATVIAIFVFAGDLTAQNLNMKTRLDSVAYVIGQNIGASLKRDELMLDMELFKAGVNDALYKNSSVIPLELMQKLMGEFQQEMQEKAIKKQTEQLDKNKAEGEAFLNANKTKPGVKTTESGLQYKVIKEGTGNSPKSSDVVKVHYRGKLLNGKEFDSSYSRNEPTEFPLNQVIKGWTEGVQLMKVGSVYTFWLPSYLAYGDEGTGGEIGPGATLEFEVELLEIVAQ